MRGRTKHPRDTRVRPRYRISMAPGPSRRNVTRTRPLVPQKDSQLKWYDY